MLNPIEGKLLLFRCQKGAGIDCTREIEAGNDEWWIGNSEWLALLGENRKYKS